MPWHLRTEEGARKGYPPWPRGERAAAAKVTMSGRKQQESSRRSKREQDEHRNERVEQRKPPSMAHGERSAELTGGGHVREARHGSGGDGRVGNRSGAHMFPLLAFESRRHDVLLAAHRREKGHPGWSATTVTWSALTCSGTGCCSPSPRRKIVVKGKLCDPVARGAHDVAHRLSDSIELNNPRGSGEGYGRTISHEGSDDELLGGVVSWSTSE